MRGVPWCSGFAAILSLICLGQSRPLVGQADRPLSPERRWEERLNRRTPLSGVLVPGVMTGDQDALALPEVITLLLRSGASGAKVCVSVTSQDGLYSAHAFFRIPPDPSRTVTLSGPSRHRRELRRYRASQLVISATLGDDCGDALATHVVPQWGTETLRQDDIFLYVNSRDYTDVSWRGLTGSVSTARCPETGEAYVVYSRVCRIPTAGLGARTALTIRQRRDGRTFVYDSVFVDSPQ
jgi:hypothetical protein